MSNTPQHDKLKEIQPLSQAIGEFLDWANEQGWHLAEWETINSFGDQMLHQVNISHTDILARHFDIDLDALEDEKLAILDEIRAAQ